MLCLVSVAVSAGWPRSLLGSSQRHVSDLLTVRVGHGALPAPSPFCRLRPSHPPSFSLS